MADEIVVFEIVGDSACAGCGEELGKGRMLRMEKGAPLCLTCADLDHLVFLARGDTALTRRAGKYSTLKAVVLRRSRARHQYERQGVLVEEAALIKAEQECFLDAHSRERVPGESHICLLVNNVAMAELEQMSFLTGSELARPFVPARNFELSKRFYEALGFEKLLDGDVAIFGIGTSSFILQDRFETAWAQNFMMQLMVDDLDLWWRHIAGLDLPGRFGVPEPRPPVLQPWGLRVAFVIDPSGVLWHIAQRRPDHPWD